MFCRVRAPIPSVSQTNIVSGFKSGVLRDLVFPVGTALRGRRRQRSAGTVHPGQESRAKRLLNRIMIELEAQPGIRWSSGRFIEPGIGYQWRGERIESGIHQRIVFVAVLVSWVFSTGLPWYSSCCFDTCQTGRRGWGCVCVTNGSQK